jgi:hypothetical protein
MAEHVVHGAERSNLGEWEEITAFVEMFLSEVTIQNVSSLRLTLALII